MAVPQILDSKSGKELRQYQQHPQRRSQWDSGRQPLMKGMGRVLNFDLGRAYGIHEEEQGILSVARHFSSRQADRRPASTKTAILSQSDKIATSTSQYWPTHN
jgi:hypothetical protein